MAKPIVVMYIPRDGYFLHDGPAEPSMELMRILNGNYGKDDPDINFPGYWLDYYWLVFPKDDITEPELQVFYEKDFKPINFQELKKFIEDALADRNKESAL